MKRVIISIVVACLLLSIPILVFGYYFNFKPEDYLNAFGYLFVVSSAVLLFFQIRINLRYAKRKAATDFVFQNIQNDLVPKLIELGDLLGVSRGMFYDKGSLTELLSTYNAEEKKKLTDITIFILNFYERMSICILKEVFDNDICYDDTGFLLIQFHHLTREFVDNLQTQKEQRAYANFRHIADRWEVTYEETKAMNKERMKRENSKRTISNQEI